MVASSILRSASRQDVGSRLSAWWLGMALGVATSTAAATGNHHSVPLGGRSALMGGTGVVLGADGAAPFLNPANIARVVDRRIAFSARFFRLSEQRYDDWHDFGNAGVGDSTRHERDLSTVPDTTCYFFSTGEARRTEAPAALVGDHKLSICFGKTEETELEVRAAGFSAASPVRRVDQIQQLEFAWHRLSAGPTWAAFLTERWAIGAALFVTRSRFEQSLVVSNVVEEATGQARASSYEGFINAYSWELVPSVGTTYRLGQHLTAGLALRAPGIHLGGSAYASRLEAAAGATEERRQAMGEGAFRAAPPLRLGAGLGGEWESVRLELDVGVHLGQSDYLRARFDSDELTYSSGAVTSRERLHVDLRDETEAVVNAGLGVELFLTSRLSLLTGIQTDRNALRPLDAARQSSRLSRVRADYYRAGLGLSSYTDFGDLVFGTQFAYGRGHIAGVDGLFGAPAPAVTGFRELALMVVLAGSVSWGSVSQAAVHMEDAVQGDAAEPLYDLPDPMRPPRRR